MKKQVATKSGEQIFCKTITFSVTLVKFPFIMAATKVIKNNTLTNIYLPGLSNSV